MSHNHFNGACEQSARNRNGAIVRNFGTGKLGARLACGKTVTPYLYASSGCVVPLAYDEDGEIETRRGIVITQGYQRAREVRAFSALGEIYAEPVKEYDIARCPISANVAKAIDILCKPRKVKGKKQAQELAVWKAKAARVLDIAIRGELRPRINKKLFQAYDARRIDGITVLRKAGLIGGRV